MSKRETYPEARQRLFAQLRSLQFEVKDRLKVPQVTWHPAYSKRLDTSPAENFKTLVGGLDTPESVRKIYFRPQAVYLDSLSTNIDIRGMSCDTFLALINDCHEKWLKIGR
jgi:hypothetical protein